MLALRYSSSSFGVRIIGFTATVKDDLYQFDGALHLNRRNRTVSAAQTIGECIRHHVQFHLNDRQQVIPAPVLVERGQPISQPASLSLFLSLLYIFTVQRAVSPDVRAIFSFHGDIPP